MAASGALCTCLALLSALLLVRCEVNTTAASVSCSTADELFADALRGAAAAPATVFLPDGCNVLQRNYACIPVDRSLSLEGSTGGNSTWDTQFGLFQFSLSSGTTLTLRNLVLLRALVFTVGYGSVQPAVFHMRNGSRLVLQNVTLQTLCSTVRYYLTSLDPSVRQLPDGQTAATARTLLIRSLSSGGGAVSLQNVTLTCDPALALPSDVDLYVHSADMLTAFVGAANGLSVTSTIYLMKNITLPASEPYDPDRPDPRVGLITTNTTLAAAEGGGLTYVDANYTAGWLYVQPPARLTLRGMLLTRLRQEIYSPGVKEGALAGGTPVLMVQTWESGVPQTPQRQFSNVTLAVPGWEVRQMAYWCVMLDLLAQDYQYVADFLRPLVWQSSCDVLGPNEVLFRRMRTVVSSLANVLLTSTPPPGVPFDADLPPPAGATAYPHVTPPLLLVSTPMELLDAMAPLLPAGNATAAELPLLILVNGSVKVSPADVVVPGGGQRVLARSVIVTSMRRNCGGGDAGCAQAVVDLGSVTYGMRLEEGSNTSIVFEGLTLRNASVVLQQQLQPQPVRAFFQFNRSRTRIVWDSINVQLPAATFMELYRWLTSSPRFNLPADTEIYSINTTFIQLASFQFVGIRGTWVNFTLLPGEAPPTPGDPAAAGGRSTLGPTIAGACVGGSAFLVLLLSIAFFAHRRRRRNQSDPRKLALEGGCVAAGSGEQPDMEGGGGEDAFPALADGGVDGLEPGAGLGAVVALKRPPPHADSTDEESVQGTATATTQSAVHSSDPAAPPPARLLAAGPGPPSGSGAGPASGSSLSAGPASGSGPGPGPVGPVPCVAAPPPAVPFQVGSLSEGMGVGSVGILMGEHDSRFGAGVGSERDPRVNHHYSSCHPAAPSRGAGSSELSPSSSALETTVDTNTIHMSYCSGSTSTVTPGGAAGMKAAAAAAAAAAVLSGKRQLGQPSAVVEERAKPSATHVSHGHAGSGAARGRSAGGAMPHVPSEGQLRSMAAPGGGSALQQARRSRTHTHIALTVVGAGGGSGRVSTSGGGHSSPHSARSAAGSRGPSFTRLHPPQPVALASPDLGSPGGAGNAPGSSSSAPSTQVVSHIPTSGSAPRMHRDRSYPSCQACLALSASASAAASVAASGHTHSLSHRSSHATATSTVPGHAHPHPHALGHGHGPGHRSIPRVVSGTTLCGDAAAAVAAGAPYSSQLMATAGTCGPLSHPYLDPDSSSPHTSTLLPRMGTGMGMGVGAGEPASEVARLISELSAHGADQLVILEPIGQGGYGTVYRGVWRNLDVAVKTVLFQDRANITPLHTPPPGAASPCGPGPVVAPGSTRAARRSFVIGEEPAYGGGGAGAGALGSGGGGRPTSTASGMHVSLGHLLAAGASRASTDSAPDRLHSPAEGGVAGTGGGAAGAAAGGGPRWPTGSRSLHHQLSVATAGTNSGSLPNVPTLGGVSVASQQRAVLEAAVSCSVTHPNVVATYHYDITPVRPSGVVCSGGLQVADATMHRGSLSIGAAAGVGGGPGAVIDWKLYLVQEFCDAGSLANALDRRAFHDPAGMPNLAVSLSVLADIARGMAHIHSRSIIHGDLNPTNILLRSTAAAGGGGSGSGFVPLRNQSGAGGSGCVTPGGAAAAAAAAAQMRTELGVSMVAKVGDFGLCGMLAPGKRHISNAQRGTPFYTSPETVDTGTLTKASDVYSFGVIVWEVYTGQPPFTHMPDRGFVRSELFPRLPPHVPPTLAAMTQACLSSDPDARPTFDQILERLMSLQSKLASSLQQRLSRLAAKSGKVLGMPPAAGPSPHMHHGHASPFFAGGAAAVSGGGGVPQLFHAPMTGGGGGGIIHGGGGSGVFYGGGSASGSGMYSPYGSAAAIAAYGGGYGGMAMAAPHGVVATDGSSFAASSGNVSIHGMAASGMLYGMPSYAPPPPAGMPAAAGGAPGH